MKCKCQNMYILSHRMKIYTQIRWLSNFHELNLETITISSWIPLFCVPKSEISESPNIFYTMYMYFSMTSLLTQNVAHSTRHSFKPKTNNQPLKKFLSLAFSWVKVVKNWRHFKIWSFQKLKFSKNINTKKCASKIIFFNEKKIERFG